MASGKQTSFQFGEVSPSLRFRSDAVSYSAGLSKLKNMYVRKSGGVSNRPGLEFVRRSEFQQDISSVGADPCVKGFTVWDADLKIWKTYEYGKLFNELFNRVEYGFLINATDKLFAATEADALAGNDKEFLEPLPKDITFTQSRSGIFVAPSAKVRVLPDGGTESVDDYNFIIQNDSIKVVSRFGTAFTFGVVITADSYLSPTGGATAPRIECSYLITGINFDDVEVFVGEKIQVFTPNAFLRNDINVFFNLGPPGFKKLNLYRAAAKDASVTPFYKFAGQIVPTAAGSVFTFSDYGAEDTTRTPPTDTSFFIPSGAGNFILRKADVFTYYQQRMIASINADSTTAIKPGDLIASKIGAPLEFSAPLIYTNTGAFQFSVPITDGTPVVAMLPMERLIAFTERGVYVIRGGEQGGLTPSSINPLLLSEEGCSKTVQPKIAGFKGYFINNSHTKLMFIVFGDDGNLKTGEASIFSSHTLLEDAVQIEILSGIEDTVYVLRRDGKLIQVTVTEEGAHGFSTVETEGYIESIFRGRAKKSYVKNQTSETEKNRYYDVLMCYVIRNGVRILERINPRDDRNKEGEQFADCHTQFGTKLADKGVDGYARVGEEYRGFDDYKINIKSITDYDAGAIVELHWNLPDPPILYEGKRIHFFYDLDGVTQTIRAVCTDDAPQVTGDPSFPIKTFAYFEADIPASLQNVRAQIISGVDKNRVMTRWVPAFKTRAFENLYYLGNQANQFPVSLCADGEVLSSPLNPNMPTIYAIKNPIDPNYVLEFPDYITYGSVGIPYECEFETLDLETGGDRTVTDTKKLINAVGLGLMETRGGFAGIPEQTLQNMTPIVTREDESFNNPTKNFNGHIVIHIPTEWNEPGRATIKHVDPTPISILSVYPKGLAGD